MIDLRNVFIDDCANSVFIIWLVQTKNYTCTRTDKVNAALCLCLLRNCSKHLK